MTATFAPAPHRSGRATLIINPISGHGADGRQLAAHLALATSTLARAGVEVQTHVTTGPGDAHQRAAAAVVEGADLVIAWGGDGTINEIGTALAGSRVALGIVPAGSGNGLARDLGLPADPARALAVAAGGSERRIDAGALNDQLFFNIGGIGLDARVAERFAARGAQRRGFGAYLRISAGELWRYQPREYTITVDGERLVRSALMITLANSRQFGNGAQIAPRARLDDGALELVVVGNQSLLRVAARIPALFRGTLTAAPGLDMRRLQTAEISSSGAFGFHVDGEPREASDAVRVTTHPGVLTVRVPTPAVNR